MKRFRITVTGIVQGVGFRPYVHGLAVDCGLVGTVLNNGSGVEMDVQGKRADEFLRRLPTEAPPLVMIVDLSKEELPLHEAASFEILHSAPTAVTTALIPPDIAICDDCLREIFDPADRRYLYPFTNCTNCGPRYTITETIPYDRVNTSMKSFALCERCKAEYTNPLDRRFHAQPNACPDCGPALDLSGQSDVLHAAAAMLHSGKIIAMRGIGGYHLAVDAFNGNAVRRLRERKRRFEKPLAVMMRTMGIVRMFCEVSSEEEALLLSPAHPIVILAKNAGSENLAASIAPSNATIGVLLPYTPFHHLLFAEGLDALVMTSANLSEEPICIAPEEAELRLPGIADAFVHHNRDILQRCDDSVLRVMRDAPQLIRRARGFAPKPVLLHEDGAQIFATGAELKNTVCLTKGKAAFLSQHIGDLDNLETLQFFEEASAHLMRIFEIEPVAVAHDMHPDYIATQWAEGRIHTDFAGRFHELPRITVQHHHAHLASCLADNSCDERALGIILDGTGYGTDGASWGGEFLLGNSGGFLRAAHFAPLAMPGGNAAVLHPWRMAMSYLREAYGHEAAERFPEFFERRSEAERNAVEFALRTSANAPVTTSCGRLFDAVASLVGLYDSVTFEAQAAIALEHSATKHCKDPYGFELQDSDVVTISFEETIRRIVDDVRRNADRAEIASRFHRTVIEACVQTAVRLREMHDVRCAALSGGVFQNARIFAGLSARLEDEGFRVLVHRSVPANDGGIALGQAVIAQTKLRGTSCV